MRFAACAFGAVCAYWALGFMSEGRYGLAWCASTAGILVMLPWFVADIRRWRR